MGRFEASVAAFRTSLKLRPDYALAHGNLGRVLLAQGNQVEAMTHLQEAVRLDPSNPRSLLGLAEALAARGDHEIAIATLDRARKLPLTEDLAKEIFARRAAYLKLRQN